MHSVTYGKVEMPRIVEIIADYTTKRGVEGFCVIVGTDSQNFDNTKIVPVIAVVPDEEKRTHMASGGGGIYFFEITRIPRISDVRQKLYTETQMSLELMDQLVAEFELYSEKTGFDYNKLEFIIHVDAGKKGPTRHVIPEIGGWVKACGYECKFKPESFVASTIADRLSK